MGSLLIVVLSIALFASAVRSGDIPEDILRDSKLTTPELIEAYGYSAEVHTVTTKDGYVLTLHRIPRGAHDSADAAPGLPVLIQHGLLCSSADWVMTKPGRALGFVMADAGYDVWLGNFRGNTYSRNHIKYSPSSKEFWDFSFQENGLYDLPAMIDYILQITKREKLFYIGHSMGTTSFFIMASTLPEYNQKIRAMFSLAPVGFMNHVTSPFLKQIAWSYRAEEWLWNSLGLYEFFPQSELLAKAGQVLCRDEAPFQDVCANVLFLIVGWDSVQLNKTELPILLAHTPAGASTKQMLHYAQEVVSGHFRHWDFGVFSNVFRYGNVVPPDYDLSRITAPVALHYSENDWMSNVVDVTRLNQSLANSLGMFRVPHLQFNHLDYMWAINAKEYLYDTILAQMKNY